MTGIPGTSYLDASMISDLSRSVKLRAPGAAHSRSWGPTLRAVRPERPAQRLGPIDAEELRDNDLQNGVFLKHRSGDIPERWRSPEAARGPLRFMSVGTIVLRLVGVGLIIFYGRALVKFTNGWLALRVAPARMKSIAAELFVGGAIALFPLALGGGLLWWWAPSDSMRPGRGIVLPVVGGLLAVGGPLMLHAAYRGRRDPQWQRFHHRWSHSRSGRVPSE